MVQGGDKERRDLEAEGVEKREIEVKDEMQRWAVGGGGGEEEIKDERETKLKR